MRNQDTSASSELGKMIREYHQKCSLPEEIARKFMLASALEPLAIKDGCTTRSVDIKDSKRLEFFVSAAINSGFAIAHLVDYLFRYHTIRGAYQFFPEAVAVSKFNRRGGKINQGILEALFPIIAAQVLYYDEIKDEPFRVFHFATKLLEKTSAEDVADLIRGKEIGNKISGVEKKYPVKRYEVLTVYDYYLYDMETERAKGELTGVLHNAQFINAFHDVKIMLEAMIKSPKERLLDKSVDAYDVIRAKHNNMIGVGLAADHSAVCLYVYIALIDHREAI